MDRGVDKKAVRGKPGVHVHYFTSHNPQVLSFEPNSMLEPITYEQICIRVFKSSNFIFTEKSFPYTEKSPSKIYPGSMHLFMLWDCDYQQWQAPNSTIHPSEFKDNSREFVLRIRFHYPPSLEKHQFRDVWENGDFFYFFAQCRHDFINDTLHDMYNCHIKDDVCVGLALADMVRAAFEKDITLKQLKAKHDYHSFMPLHISRKTRNLFVKLKIGRNVESTLDETYSNFYCADKNPHRCSIVSYLHQLLPSVPDYACEEFSIVNHGSQSEKVLVHPYKEKQPGIHLSSSSKDSTEFIGEISDLLAIDIRVSQVLLHFQNSKPQHLEFPNHLDASSFVALLEGYYRLMTDYHYCLSNHVFSPIVKYWNELKCYGPISKDYLKTIWKRNPAAVVEGTFLIKQKSTSFDDFVIIYHKMGRNFPAIPILYNPVSHTYSCDEDAMKQLVQSHHVDLSFTSIRELIRYYRSGDCKNFKFTTQLSPIPHEQIPLMLCRDKSSYRLHSGSSVTQDVRLYDMPVIVASHDVHIESRIGDTPYFDIMEGSFMREVIVVKQLKDNICSRDILTLYFQKDVQKCCHWNHDSIVKILGVCLSPFFVISQRMPEGRLDQLLKKKSDSLKIYHFVQATGQLAQAILYLETHGFTHGCVRAKSVLVSQFDSHGHIDVKLSADMMTSYFASLPLNDKHNLERLPWLSLEKWTNLHMETNESDVYSFGMTVWEIFSLGERPFTILSTIEEIKGFIESGKVLPVPSSIEKLDENNEQFESLMNVIYKKIILDNINTDPSCRMKPQDTVRELILLNSKFSPILYDPLLPIAKSGSTQSFTSKTSENSRASKKLGDACSLSSSNSLNDRPLPSIPQSSPLVQPHIISQANIIGLENGSAVKLGQGFYGEVYQCKLRVHDTKQPVKCAVKKLIQKDPNDELFEKNLKEFERELKIMVPLLHKNIVKVFGECFYTYEDGHESRLIVMEYVKCGNLASFVRDRGCRIPLDERMLLYNKFALDVAEGMLFLHSLNEGIIHRDLAARNVLITDEPYVAKITDFGLARILSEKDYYRCDQQSILPVLWCAPECLSMKRFSKASDVWSYAVLLWEMYSNGKRPLIETVNRNVRDDGLVEVDIQSLIDTLNSSGPSTRLSKPADIKAEIYNLMVKCWHSEPDKRPSFDLIKSEFLKYVTPWS